jgi:hypothetical protein
LFLKENNPAKWTILLYDDADFSNAYDPLTSLVNNVGSTENINLLVLCDKEFDDANIYLLNEEYQQVLKENLGEVNMGNYSTLRYFLGYAKTNFPAERYLLTLYNHGGGWLGACWDTTNNSDNLEMDEINRALYETGGVDIITFSACSMGCIESVYELRNVVDVYIGSEEQHGFGMYWLEIPFILDEFANESTNALAEKIIEIYKQSYPYFGTIFDWTIGLLTQKLLGILPYPPALTISAIDANKISTLASSIDNLSKILIENYDKYKSVLSKVRIWVEDYPRPMTIMSPFGDTIDIIDFVNRIDIARVQKEIPQLHLEIENIKKFHNQLIIDEHHQIGHRKSHGLSIYYPPQINPIYYKKFSDLYVKCDLDFTIDTHWDEFLLLLNGNTSQENDSYVDQSQKTIETSGILCDEFTWAQSFIPTKESLTKIALPILKKNLILSDVELSIRESLTGNDLVICSKSPKEISYSTMGSYWLVFDLDDISVQPGKTYFIVCKTKRGNRNVNYYSWLSSRSDEYKQGESWLSNDLGKSWHNWYELNNVSFDFGFKTYF